jgi:hypothetical protein
VINRLFDLFSVTILFAASISFAVFNLFAVSILFSAFILISIERAILLSPEAMQVA